MARIRPVSPRIGNGWHPGCKRGGRGLTRFDVHALQGTESFRGALFLVEGRPVSKSPKKPGSGAGKLSGKARGRPSAGANAGQKPTGGRVTHGPVLLGKDADQDATPTHSHSGKSGTWGTFTPSVRMVETRVKSARGRKKSSTRWLHRQLNDPYVAEARAQGLRSRAAFKLIELDERFNLLRPGMKVVDLGAAPGGWTQIAVERVKPGEGQGKVVGIDILEWDTVPGAECITMDFLDPDAPDRLKAALGGKADLVMSDMAAPTSGHPQTDHLRIMSLLEVAWHFAEEVLEPGGTFVCKVFQGGTVGELLTRMKSMCDTVKHAKPPASRKESPELYVIAQGFRGLEPPASDD